MGSGFHDGWYDFCFVAAMALVFTLHEMGHYIAAALCGVNVESVIIGFGREVWSRRGSNGTLWSVRLLPVAGRIHLYAHNREEREQGPVRGLFARQSWRRRFLIVAAGPLSNFLLAIFALAFFYSVIGLPSTPAIATGIEAGSPAMQAGVQPGDEVIAMDGRLVVRMEEIWRINETRATRPVRLTLLRHGQKVDISAMPEWQGVRDDSGFSHPRGRFGFIAMTRPLSLRAIVAVGGQPTGDPARTKILLAGVAGKRAELSIRSVDKTVHTYLFDIPPSDRPFVKQGKDEAIYLSPYHDNFYLDVGTVEAWREATRETSRLMHGLFQLLGHLGPLDHSLVDPGTTVSVGTAPVLAIVFSFVYFVAMWSLSIAVINILPLPWFDGGILLFIALEAVVGKKDADLLKPYIQRFIVLLMAAGWTLMNEAQLASWLH